MRVPSPAFCPVLLSKLSIFGRIKVEGVETALHFGGYIVLSGYHL